MHARVARFEGARPEQADEAIRIVRERYLPEFKGQPGFAGYLLLIDRERGTSLGVTLFDTEEALKAGDRALDQMTPPPEFRDIRRTSVERYEVAFQEAEGEARSARVTGFEGPPGRIDEGTRYAEENVLPTARQIEGWQGCLSLVDRSTGKSLLVTLWESQEALRASEEQADRLRRQTAEGGGETITGVERYEVAIQKVAVRAGVGR